MTSLRTSLAVAAVLVAASAACAEQPPAEDDDAVLQAELAAVQDRNEELEERLARLESQVDASLGNRTDDGDDALSDVTASLSGLTDRLGTLEGQVQTEAEARAEATSDAEEATSDVRRTLDEVRSDVETLQGEVDELGVLYETLRDRLDRQQRP